MDPNEEDCLLFATVVAGRGHGNDHCVPNQIHAGQLGPMDIDLRIIIGIRYRVLSIVVPSTNVSIA